MAVGGAHFLLKAQLTFRKSPINSGCQKALYASSYNPLTHTHTLLFWQLEMIDVDYWCTLINAQAKVVGMDFVTTEYLFLSNQKYMIKSDDKLQGSGVETHWEVTWSSTCPAELTLQYITMPYWSAVHMGDCTNWCYSSSSLRKKHHCDYSSR